MLAIPQQKNSLEPRLVIRGETMESGETAHIDWFAFSVRSEEKGFISVLREILFSVFNIPFEAWLPTNSGWYGYKCRVDLGGFGLLAYGGDSQKGTFHIEINSHGCALVKDWNQIIEWGTSNGAWITRVDLAHDDFDGETINIEKAKQWYQEGGFTSAGRPPTPRLIDDLGSGKGKTFYIGERKNGKLARIYEKGKEQGDANSPWVRAEVEWRSKDRCIPWEIVLRPGEYLSGAYPCLKYLSNVQEKIKTVSNAAKINYQRMVEWLHTAAGKALNVMLTVHQGDASAVLARLVRDGAPKRLMSVDSFIPELIGCGVFDDPLVT